jgi:hypothetical protein
VCVVTYSELVYAMLTQSTFQLYQFTRNHRARVTRSYARHLGWGSDYFTSELRYES